MALIPCTTALAAGSSATATGGASALLVGANPQRNGLRVTVDTAAANPVYLLLGAGTASATNFHIVLAAGAFWDGQVSEVVWQGAVQFFSGGANHVGVVEV